MRISFVNPLTQDVQATLVAFTATSIAQAIKNSHLSPERVLICGGGVHNGVLLVALQEALPELLVNSTQSVGVDPDFLEAMMFAWLAEQTLNGVALDLKSITGASKPAVLGAIYHQGIDKGNSNKV